MNVWHAHKHISIDNLARLSIFLFPIFVVSVRHWASLIFISLFCLGVSHLFLRARSLRQLYKEEYILIGVMTSFFAAYLLSSFLNGWGKSANYALGTEIRYLMFIPIYILIRKTHGAIKYLAFGSVFGVLVALIPASYEHYVLNVRAQAVYGSLFLGMATVMFVTIYITASREIAKRYVRYMSGAVLLSAIFVVNFSQARSAYIGMLVLFFILLVSNVKNKLTVIYVILGLLLLLMTSVSFLPEIKHRFENSLSSFKNYIEYYSENPDKPNPYSEGDGVRLEMLRSLRYFFVDSPFFGVGRFNYQSTIGRYVEEGKVHPAVFIHGHPHNVFAEAFVSKGLLGLLIVLGMFLYPAWIFWKYRVTSKTSSVAGIAFIGVLLAMMQTDSAVITKNNFIAIFLVGLSVLFSWHLNKVYSSDARKQN